MSRAASARCPRLRAPNCFSLHLPVCYRFDGEGHWHVGLTETVGDRRVVIRARHGVRQGARMTIVVALPALDVNRAGCLLARAYVAGAGQHSRGTTRAFAASLTSRRLERRERVLDRLAA